MALGTYADLRAAYQEVSGDVNTTTTTLDAFLALVEARLNTELRVSQMEAVTTLSATSGVAALPSDFLEERKVTYTGSSRRVLQKVAADFIDITNPTASSGLPTYYTLVGSNLYLDMALTTSALSLIYYQSIPALTSSNTTNWVTTKAPQLYYYGILVEYAAMYKDQAGLEMYGRLFQQAFDTLVNQDKGARFSGMTYTRRGVSP